MGAAGGGFVKGHLCGFFFVIYQPNIWAYNMIVEIIGILI